MGFRFRRSFSLLPGVRVTVTSRGVSASAGRSGARVSVNSHGELTRTLSIPGTGISHVRTTRPRSPQHPMSILKAILKRFRTS